MELQKAAVIAMLDSYAAATDRLRQHQAGAVQQRRFFFRRHRRVDVLGHHQSGQPRRSDRGDQCARADRGDRLRRRPRDRPAGHHGRLLGRDHRTTKGLVYFFSDGVPENDVTKDTKSSYPGGSPDNSLDRHGGEHLGRPQRRCGLCAPGSPTRAWYRSPLVSARRSPRCGRADSAGRVAYYNESFKDDPVIVVNDENELIAEIIQTVPATVTGNVLTNDDPARTALATRRSQPSAL